MKKVIYVLLLALGIILNIDAVKLTFSPRVFIEKPFSVRYFLILAPISKSANCVTSLLLENFQIYWINI